MKKVSAVIVGLVVALLAFSQDLVVTVANDSIACKVVGFSEDSLFYSIDEPTTKNGKAFNRFAIHQADVLVYRVNYEAWLTTQSKILPAKPTYPRQRFRLSVFYGLANKLNFGLAEMGDNIHYTETLYIDKVFGADFTWFYTPKWGGGVAFNRYHTAERFDCRGEVVINGVTYTTVIDASDRRSITYLGPQLIRRMAVNKDKTYLLMGASAGCIWYNNFRNTNFGDYTITGNTIGGQVEFGIETRVSEHVSFGAKTSLLLGWIDQLNWDNGTTIVTAPAEGKERSLHRLDLSVSLQVHL